MFLLASLAAAITQLSLVDELKSIQRKANVPAVALVVIDPDRGNLVEAWGRTGNAQTPTATATTPFRLGSISKTFTALTMLRLVNEGAVSLDARVRDLIGTAAFDNPWATSHPLRVIHLLELTGGLPDLSRIEWDNNNPKPLTLAEAMALNPDSRRLLWPPGVQHSYSNIAPGLSALVIEHLTGDSFEAAATDRVLAPLGMRDSSWVLTPALAARLPRGYRADGKTEIPYWHMTFRAFGALSASAQDMARFLTAMLADPDLSKMATPHSTLAAAAGLKLGYGLGIYGAVRHGHLFLTHGGDADGFRSRYGLLPNAGRGYFVAINADAPGVLGHMRRVIEAHLTNDLELPTPPREAATDSLSVFAGTYYPAAARFRINQWRNGELPTARVEARGPVLAFEREGRATNLVPVGRNLFRRESDPVATVAFVRNGPSLFVQGELGNHVRLDTPCRPPFGRAFITRCVWQ